MSKRKLSLIEGLPGAGVLILAAASLAVWTGVTLTFYLYGLQLKSTLISLPRLAVSGLVGLVWLLLGGFILVMKAAKGERLSAFRLRQSFFAACVVCGFFWILIPVPENFLFSKAVNLNVSVAPVGSVAAPLEIVWIHNGLEDVSYRAVTLPPDASFTSDAILLPVSASGITRFSWSGRAWKQIVMAARSPQPVLITVELGSQTYEFQSAQDGGETNISIPAAGKGYYLLVNLSVLLAGFFASTWLCLLAGFIPAAGLIRRLERILPPAPPAPAIGLFGIALLAVVCGYMVAIGFSNRMYADDYCYTVMAQNHGFWGAIFYAYQYQNGRLVSHVINFLALSLGNKGVPFGPLAALGLAGGSLFFLLAQLLEGERKARYAAALLSTLLVITAVFFIIPDLYNSVFWTLHAIIATGGMFCLNILLGLLARFGPAQTGRFRRFWLAGLCFLLSFAAAGFNEAASLVIIALLGLLGVLLLVISWQNKTRSALLVPVLIALAGSIAGLGLVLLAPGNNRRVYWLGFESEIAKVLSQYYSVLQVNLNHALIERAGVGLILFGAVVLGGYAMGRLMPVALKGASHLERSRIPMVHLVWLPFALSVAAFVPSAFVSGFFPPRTLLIPVYFLCVFYFIAAVYLGVRQRSSANGKTLLSYSLSLAVLALSVVSFVSLGGYARQMRLFAAEWDAREKIIQQAVARGEDEVLVLPYETRVGPNFIDLSPEKEKWLSGCLENYYGIKIGLKQP
jgi:hypothetical protein